MPRSRSRKPSVSPEGPKRPSSAGLPNLRQEAAKDRKAWLHDLVDMIMGWPPIFPIKHSTGEALFSLALEQLAHHDKTTADALRRYSGLSARLEVLDLSASTLGLPPGDAIVAKLRWLLEEPPMHSTEDLRDNFHRYRRAVGKRTCHPTTLRRQDELLRAYGRAHNYPAGARVERVKRLAWAYTHLPAMIAEAQGVPCWHPQPDLTKQDLDDVLNGVDAQTSLIKLSALVLAQLHATTTDYLLKHVLPRRRR